MTEGSGLTRRERRLLHLAAIGAVVVLVQFAVTVGLLVWKLVMVGGTWTSEPAVITEGVRCAELMRDNLDLVLCGDESGTFRRGTGGPATPTATRSP